MRKYPLDAKHWQTLQNHKSWPQLEFLIQKLNSKGFMAYLVGGSVRDLLLNTQLNDFDLATDADPIEVESLFKNVKAVGKSFGVSLVTIDSVDFEVARFRKEDDYRDGRHPENIIFSNPFEDAKRRDFTVNAMFLNLQEKTIIDYVDGYLDLKNKQLRCVGVAKKRFSEDYLRILRLFRFQFQLGFNIEEETLKSAYELRQKIKFLAVERIRNEIDKMLKSGNWHWAVAYLYDFDWELKQSKDCDKLIAFFKTLSCRGLNPIYFWLSLFVYYKQNQGVFTQMQLKFSHKEINFFNFIHSLILALLERNDNESFYKGRILSLLVKPIDWEEAYLTSFISFFYPNELRLFLQLLLKAKRLKSYKPLITGVDLLMFPDIKKIEYKKILYWYWCMQLEFEIESKMKMLKKFPVLEIYMRGQYE